MTKERAGKVRNESFEAFFKIGVSQEYILVRRDFPMREISPGDFSRLIEEMFRRNEEVLNDGE